MTDTPKPDQPSYSERHFEKFMLKLEARLLQGQIEYGESSFTRPLIELVGEVQEELEDVSGWAYLLWVRMEKLKQKIKEIERD